MEIILYRDDLLSFEEDLDVSSINLNDFKWTEVGIKYLADKVIFRYEGKDYILKDRYGQEKSRS